MFIDTTRHSAYLMEHSCTKHCNEKPYNFGELRIFLQSVPKFICFTAPLLQIEICAGTIFVLVHQLVGCSGNLVNNLVNLKYFFLVLYSAIVECTYNLPKDVH
ncbi:hypothetical protein J6590_057858 [Homalodisca vitripennis]|nr:hypothetical protein J6590_057858 [Homalodisca vitripennis]